MVNQIGVQCFKFQKEAMMHTNGMNTKMDGMMVGILVLAI